MDHKISFERACTFMEIYEVEEKIRASNCTKKDSSLAKFNWYIRSWCVLPGKIVFACLVAKTRGTGYSAKIMDVPDDILNYWK